jgi:cell division protein FtsQ
VARRARWIAGRALWLALVLAIAAGGAVGSGWLLSSPRFAIGVVEVSGQSRMSQEEVEAAAAIAPGTNIFTLDVDAVVARLEALPLVRRADVVRHLPNRVSIMVEERRPFTLVHTGKLHWIDEHGVDLGPEERPVVPAVPVISGLGGPDLAAPQAGASERAATGLALVRLLLRSGSALVQSISEIDVSRPEGPVLYTLDGVEVRLGKEDWEARLGRLLGVLAQLKASGEAVTSIDLRFRDQVVLKTAMK